MNRTIFSVLAVAGASLLIAAPASPRSGTTLTIRHQLHGCHTWSVNGGAFKASQSIVLAKGARLTIIDDDVMPHRLVKVSGPSISLPAAVNMNRPGATAHVTFTKAGAYRFMTKAGEDYVKGIKTIGEDNVLTLKVTVT